MRNFLKVIGFAILMLGLAKMVNAQILFEKGKIAGKTDLRIVGFIDYPPFGQDRGPYKKFMTPFATVVKEALETYEFNARTHMNVKSYDEILTLVKSGGADVILGMYYDTKAYRGIYPVMPAVIENPVVLIMLPDKINNVTNANDLKKLKGAISTTDRFTDFVGEELQKLSIEKIDNPYVLYEKLFNGEIDYILSSYYLAFIQTTELGIRSHIAFSKSPLWTMPIFIGVGNSKHSKRVKEILDMAMKPQRVREAVKKELQQILEEVELENAGKVPPPFVTNRVSEPIIDTVDKVE